MYQENSFLKKVNFLELMVTAIASVLCSITYIFECFAGTRTLLWVIIMSSINFVPVIISTILYKTNPLNKYLKLLLFMAFFSTYTILLFSSKYITVYSVAFPLICTYSLYFDKKFMYFISCLVLLLNASYIAYNVYTGNTSTDYVVYYLIQVCTIFIYLFSLIAIVIVSSKQRTDLQNNSIEIEKSHGIQKQMVEDIFKTIKVIDTTAQDLFSIIKTITKSSQIVSKAINQISAGTENTSEDLQKQNLFADEIQKKILYTSQTSKDMDNSSKVTENVVTQGINIVNQLSAKSNIVNEKNNNVFLIMDNLKEKSNQIEKITQVITSISDQTNLLAINATIEAARVGELGKGFGVVANEVGKLADQSRISATGIAQIIAELQLEITKSVEAVTNLIEVNNEQNGLVKETEKVLNDINLNTLGVRSKIGIVNSSVDEILDANEKIVSSICNISAISQQTMANAEETANLSSEYIKQADEAEILINNLMKVSKDIKKYIE